MGGGGQVGGTLSVLSHRLQNGLLARHVQCARFSRFNIYSLEDRFVKNQQTPSLQRGKDPLRLQEAVPG